MSDDITRRDFVVRTTATVGAIVLLPGCLEAGRSVAVPAEAAVPVGADVVLLEGTFRVNGVERTARFDPRVTLLDLLRDGFELTGAKKGCDHAQCGSCTVLVDGKRINACLALAAQNRGKEITTIEGLAHGHDLHPMQQAFLDQDAFQCGFCTPGQIMSAVALMNEPCGPGEAGVRECMSGNLCRCGAYRNIVAAINQVRG